MDFDTLILGGTVVDGTGAAAQPADLALAGGRIAAIGNPGSLGDGTTGARLVIDARAAIVCPGFIDIHTHSDVTLLDDPGAESKAYQGVTTEVPGNCSYSPFPVRPGDEDALKAIFGPELASATPWPWHDLDGWAAAHEQRGISINLAPLLGHSAVRLAAGLMDDRRPMPAELEAMQRLVVESIEQGAFGMSTGLTLAPSTYADTDEIVALAQPMAAFGDTFYATHARVWAGYHVRAVEEAVEVGRRAGVPVEYSHIAIIDPRAFGQADAMLAVIERARAGGLDVTCDVYPYTAAGTGLMQFLPEWVQEGGVEAMLGRLRDRSTRARARADAATGWFRGLPWAWESLVISDISTPANAHLVGRSLAEAATLRSDADPVDTFLALIDEESNGVAVVAHNRTEPDMRAFLTGPHTMIGSDGTAISPDGHHGRPQRPHPRYYGTYPRTLGRYVREERVLGLEEAIHKMTGMPAQRLGMRQRGILRDGAVADVVVFDPSIVRDLATFEDPHAYPAGIDWVLVAGTPVIAGGTHTGARPGRVLRRGAA